MSDDIYCIVCKRGPGPTVPASEHQRLQAERNALLAERDELRKAMTKGRGADAAAGKEQTMSPWFVWISEYPEEGSVVVDAECSVEAEAAGRAVLCGDEPIPPGETEPVEMTARLVTAEDVGGLQDKVEELEIAHHQCADLRAKLEASEAVCAETVRESQAHSAESASLRSRLETAEKTNAQWAEQFQRLNDERNNLMRKIQLGEGLDEAEPHDCVSEVRRAVEEAAVELEQRANRAFLPNEPIEAIRRELLGAAKALRSRSRAPAPAVEIPPTDANGSPADLPCACPPGHVNDCPNRAP